MKHYILVIIHLLILSSCNKEIKKNQLKNHSSKYLSQHSDNPIWWQEWNESTIENIKKQNRPVFLSIGYSSCHWCHVMEEEVFMNPEVARLLNNDFISIKVDKEERPDINLIFQKSVSRMGLKTGWPLNVFLSPNLEALVGVTYLEKDKFIRLIKKVEREWRTNKSEVTRNAKSITELIEKELTPSINQNLTYSPVDHFYSTAIEYFDKNNGGFGDYPKFPKASTLSFLADLYISDTKKFSEVSNILNKSFRGISKAGLYDHIEGGFFRYSVDKKWWIPHYEKMLYTNATILEFLIKYRKIKKSSYLDYVINDTVNFMLKNMSSSNRLFINSINASNDKGEGRYYFIRKKDLDNLLNSTEKIFFKNTFYIPEDINSSKDFHLIMKKPIPLNTQQVNLLSKIKNKLSILRKNNQHPEKDTKIITSWNALAINSILQAGIALKKSEYIKLAIEKAENIWRSNTSNNKVFRTQSKTHIGFLDDYAYLIRTFINIFLHAGDIKWLKRAISLQEIVNKEFWDSEKNLFLTTRDKNEIFKRSVSFQDQSVPNSNAVSAQNLISLYKINLKKDYINKAQKLINGHITKLLSQPISYSQFFKAYFDFNKPYSKQVVIVFPNEISMNSPLIKQVKELNIRDLQILPIVEKNNRLFSIFHHKNVINKKPTAYYCENMICKKPTTDPEELIEFMQNN